MLFDLERQGVAVIGRIPTGLPGFSLPLLSLEDFDSLLPVALVAALLSFSDTIVTARGFAARIGERIDADQELLAIGVANLASGLSHGLPISASNLRTAVAEAAGSRTQVTPPSPSWSWPRSCCGSPACFIICRWRRWAAS